ncbi:MAG: DUF6515 family protein [Ferruginibacter sp.]
MKISTNAFRLMAALCFMLILSSGVDAQNNRSRRHGNYYGSRPRVSVGIGINPHYDYRPALRPRIYYHPPYRLPYRYGHFGPAFGLRIGILPFGYSQFFIGGDPYYYNDGIYYRPYSSGGYTVTAPPLGAMVKHLPSGTKVSVIDGQKYYVIGGTFYQERTSSNNKVRYEVVGTDGVLNTTNADADEDDNDTTQAPPPAQGNNNSPAPVEGTIVNQLPAGSTAIIISQQKYYLSPAGVYYEEMMDANNKVSYKVAGTSAPATKTDAASSGLQ